MSTRIIICRHGNTFDKGDVITRVGARTDLPLSVSGRAQADALGAYFDGLNGAYKFERAFCSDLLRTRQTAEAILSKNHEAVLLEKAFLKEIDYGVDENIAEEDVVARLGQEAITAWDRDATVPDGWDVDPNQIIEDWRMFFEEMSQISGDVLVVTSNGIARFCLDVINHIEDHAVRKLKTGAFGIVTCDATGSRLSGWNTRP